MISDDFSVASNGNIRRSEGATSPVTVLDLWMYLTYQSDLDAWRGRKSFHNARMLLTSWWGMKTWRGTKLRRFIRYGLRSVR